MKIAVIGAGITGNAAALALSQATHRNDVVIYERDKRAGGHSATVDIDYDGTSIAVDTGFIVYNEKNYPNLTAMFDFLGVATQLSDMSFSVSADRGRFEWCGRDGGGVLNALFAQRRNIVSPSFLHLLLEIGRFQKQAIADARARTVGEGSLADYLARHRFSRGCATITSYRWVLPSGQPRRAKCWPFPRPALSNSSTIIASCNGTARAGGP